MALDTYDNLKAAVASWIHRTDLTAQIPDFITLAEAQMNLRITSRRKIVRLTETITGEFLTVPADFAGMRAFKTTSGDYTTLSYISPEQMADKKDGVGTSTGQAQFYTIVGDEFEFYPVPGGSYSAAISYYQAIPALSVSNTSNWVLASHPDAYLFGALAAAAIFKVDDARLQTFGPLFASILAGINDKSIAESVGGSMQMTTTGLIV